MPSPIKEDMRERKKKDEHAVGYYCLSRDYQCGLLICRVMWREERKSL
jgi:hypothetical protein